MSANQCIHFLLPSVKSRLPSIALDLKDIHMSYPDVSMNYIKSPLFLDVSIEIAKFNSRDLWFLFCF